MQPIHKDSAEINGARIAYEIAGDRPPLVLIHAGIADRRLWDDQVSAFAPRWPVIRYDMRGYGETAMPDGEFSHRADLEGLLDHLGVRNPILVGCSMGGRVALDYTLAHPDRVPALVLVNSPPGGFDASGYPRPAQLHALDAADEAGDVDRFNELELQIWVDGPHRTPDQVDPAVREKVRRMNRIALESETAGLGEETPPAPAWDRLGELRLPVLLIAGILDQPHVVAGMRQMAERIPGARLVEIEGAAHLPNLEQPEAFNRALREFLDEVKP